VETSEEETCSSTIGGVEKIPSVRNSFVERGKIAKETSLGKMKGSVGSKNRRNNKNKKKKKDNFSMKKRYSLTCDHKQETGAIWMEK